MVFPPLTQIPDFGQRVWRGMVISFCGVSCPGEEEMEGKKASVAGGLLSILTEQKLNKEMFGIQVRLPRRTLEELPRNAGLN